MGAETLPPPSGNLAAQMRGVWWLLTREDHRESGEKRIDPTLGADPLGILTYGESHFAAQFMKRDRSDAAPMQATYTGANNTAATGGYDAYFGTFSVDEETGKVLHTLLGSITPSNVGLSVSRDMRVEDDRLIIQLDTTTPEGEPVTRTLKWKRVG